LVFSQIKISRSDFVSLYVFGEYSQVDLKSKGESGFKFLVSAAKKIKDMDSHTLLTNHRHPVVDSLLEAYDEFFSITNNLTKLPK
jgi:phosphate starvation-inducible protein PhoH